MININAKLTISIRDDEVIIEIRDDDALVTFFSGSMEHGPFIRALGRLAHVEFKDAQVGMLDKVGKFMEHKELIFPLPDTANFTNRAKAAEETAEQYTPDGWEAYKSYDSQDSFPTIDGKPHAKTIIKRWVAK